MLSAPEIVPPADAPAPDFVTPCDQEVADLYNKIWTRLKK
jgi:spermidine/putrescine transport system substrate-binding protein